MRIAFTILIFSLPSLATACRYTIREIGFSTLNEVNYILYRVNATNTYFPSQLKDDLALSNVKVFSLNSAEDASHPIVEFVRTYKLTFPAYVLATPDGRQLSVVPEGNRTIIQEILFSSSQKQLLAALPKSYATVLLVESSDQAANTNARKIISQACDNVRNMMPYMPKQVDFGPEMKIISLVNFTEERTLLWSLGLEEVPNRPLAFVIYGRGRVMGEQIEYTDMQNGNVYKLLSIIGADCECGLDRKWMLGYQVPLHWPATTSQQLTNLLGFDVDNPMVLTEMSRILAIENRTPANPDGVSFEPQVIDLDEEFDEIPEVYHGGKEDGSSAAIGGGRPVVLYSFLGLALVLLIGTALLFRPKQS